MIKKKGIFRDAKNANASGLHKKVLALVQEVYGGLTILEEERIDCNVNGKMVKLPVDIVIKSLKVAIEVQGQQHFEHNPRFHPSLEHFKNQKNRDRAKHEAIVSAGWGYIAIAFNEVDSLTAKKLTALVSKAIEERP